jgi:DnaJ-domain-containing protein 1
VQPSVPIDPAWQERIEQAYCSSSPQPWIEAESAAGLPAQIDPVLGEDAEPDPTFFVESWTVGFTAASENYLRRHPHEKSHESPAAGFPSFSFVTFLNIEPPAPAVPPASSPTPAGPAKNYSAAATWYEEEKFVPGPLTFQTACSLLGVTATSTRDQIRAAYRKMASRYHPDRLEHAEPRDTKLASDRMASINEAYRLLCDVAVERTA